MENRWDGAAAAGLPSREELAYVSRLLGADEHLVLAGGGNTSVKADGEDQLGRPERLLHVKPSGVKLDAIEAADFTAVRMRDVLPLEPIDDMDDAEMVRLVRCAMVDPSQRLPSIETLLHAFLPDTWVLHSHADALLSVCNRSDGPDAVRRVLGDDVALAPFRRPGFLLSKEVAALRRDHPHAHGVVLLQHGLVTFGETAQEAYDRHIDLVARCEDAATPKTLAAVPRTPAAARAWAPRLRGALETPRILVHDDRPDVLAFLGDDQCLAATQKGPATPDHMLRTRRVPCVVRDPDDIARYRDADRAYSESGDREGLPVLPPDPRVLLVPGAGLWTTGATVEEARLVRDIAVHTLAMIRQAGADWRPISVSEAHHAEYWYLEQRKLLNRPSEGELEGRVAWISGAASGIGRAIARRFAAEGAHLVLVDVDAAGLDAVREEFGARAVARVGSVADEAVVQASFDDAVRAFGGVDVVVSNAGVAKAAPLEELTRAGWDESLAVNATAHFLVAKHALALFRAQGGHGGALVFNASKNVPAPGKGFAAYSAAKAAETQLARIAALEGAELGVRANVLHPDAVFRDTRLWSDEIRAERARAHGVPVDELEAFYARRNLLGRAVRPEDVAEAALFLATDRSSRTTGATLTVDGGVREAFPR